MKSKTSRSNRASHRAFTLVEMLVAVTLVLLMMTMFASIFQMATGSVTKQRAISNNDQRVRALSTLIRSDFAHRTFRFPQSFYPGEDSSTSVTPFGDRAGYIYISTNDPYSSLDDLIQFTVNSDIVVEDPDGTPYAGKASMLVDRLAPSTPSVLAINTNQPEADDGSSLLNSTGGSNAAEVCYFVRNGNLYRKVMLLRRPLPVAGKDLDEQPTAVRGNDFFANADGEFETTVSGRSDDFWKHFDYSAVPQFSSGVQHAGFVGASALSNETVGGPNSSLGNPRYRFGFNFAERDSANNLMPTTGNSREHTSVANPFFIGRPLHAETSSIRFNWPQQLCEDTSGNLLWSGNPSPGNPFDVRNGLNLNAATGVVTEFADGARGGDRRTEDLVLSNVHEFRIEIWDERLQKYTTPGHQERALFRYLDPNTNNLASTTIVGDYHIERMAGLSPVPNTAPYDDARIYGPMVDLASVTLPPTTRVFDTWHPQVNRNQDAQLDAPPFLPYRYHPPLFPDGPSSAFIPVNDVDRTTKTAVNRGYWRTNMVMQLGDIVFVPRSDAPPLGEFSYSEIPEPKFNIAYRVVGLQNGGQTDATTPPVFPTTAGKRFRERNNQIEWESLENRRPLSSVRLTIRFLDPQSESLRQLTLIIPLIDRR